MDQTRKLWNMLMAISNKIVHSANHIYIHGEDAPSRTTHWTIIEYTQIPTTLLRHSLSGHVTWLVKESRATYGKYAHDRHIEN